MQPGFWIALALVPLLGACGASGGGTVKSTGTQVRPPKASTTAPQPVRPPTRYRPRNPPVIQQGLPGLEAVIGSSADALIRQFGPARLDVWEGDARKLQFSGEACVLDAYLYPGKDGAAPTVAYIDARRATDGQDVDRAACVNALKKK